MSDQILLKQHEFNALTAAHESATGALPGLRFNANRGANRLNSVDALGDCLRGLNEALVEFQTITRADVQNLRAIEREMLRVDRAAGQRFDQLNGR